MPRIPPSCSCSHTSACLRIEIPAPPQISEEDMSSLEGQQALVTGATGFIGSRLCERLVGKGAGVRGMGRRLKRAAHLGEQGVELMHVDLGKARKGNLQDLVRDCDVIFHAAAATGADPAVAEAINVEASVRIARAAMDEGVQRFVHLSTVGVYDMTDLRVVEEDVPLAVDHPAAYPRTKARAERALRELTDHSDLELAVLRPSMVYGPGHGLWTVQMARNVCEGKPVYLGDGSYTFNPVYLDDVVDALLLCATSEAAAGEAFNVSADATTWRDFMGRYTELCDVEPKGLPLWVAKLMALANHLPGVQTPIDTGFIEMATSHKRFPIDKARERLGWEPRTSLDEGMARTLAWLRETAPPDRRS